MTLFQKCFQCYETFPAVQAVVIVYSFPVRAGDDKVFEGSVINVVSDIAPTLTKAAKSTLSRATPPAAYLRARRPACHSPA